MENIDISTFIPEYPNIKDPNFNLNILKKAEFYDLRLKSDEGVPENKGDLLDSQKILKRFFSPHTPYQKALFFHDPGTGKCVHPKTKILTDQGIFEAEEIWNWFSTQHKSDGVGIWSKPSSDIMVKSYNENSKMYEDAVVLNLYKQYIVEPIKEVIFEDGTSIEITKIHKLYAQGEDSAYRWTNKFKIGYHVLSFLPGGESGGGKRIKNIIFKYYDGWVYDLEVTGHHNYVANGILCHNTCLSSSIIESSKNMTVNGKRRKRALVIVKNDGLRRKYIKDVATICTAGIYEPKYTDAELLKGIKVNQETKSRRMKAEVQKTYEIVTIETFLKNLTDDVHVMESEYSNRDILIDEAHVLRIQAKTKASGDDPVIDSKQYEKMHKFLHAVKGCRIFLFTGTPIWDDVSEIASLMNLILDEKDQLPTRSEFNKEYFNRDELVKDKIPHLKNIFKGKISYLRSMVTTAKREEIGVTKPWFKYIKVFPVIMSKNQGLYVKEAQKEVDKKGRVLGFSRYAREASNMIIPVFDKNGGVEDYKYDPESFKKYTTTQKKTLKGEGTSLIYKITDPVFKKYILNNLKDISAKFAFVIEDIKAHPNEIVFIYNEFVVGTGGAIMLALCLEIHGFTWIKKSEDISIVSKQKRFAVITSNEGTTNDPLQIEKLLESSNKPDNKYGDRLQIIIGSEKIALGLDIKNVRRIHVITPDWNIPSIDQAMARGFRFGGHDSLPENERYIKIFKHVAVEKGNIELPEGVGYPDGTKVSDKETIDVHVYDIAESKEYKNKQIYRVLKEVAFDCGLFYKRNVLAQDVDGSRDCDYKKCKYKCDSLPINKDYPADPYRLNKKDIDYSTYNLFYADPHVEILIDEVRNLFQNYFSLDIYSIIKLLDIEERRILMLIKALDIIIDTRIEIRDRFGFSRYLKEDGNIYFLDSTVSGSTRYLNTVYVESPFVTDVTPLETLVDVMELQNDKKNIYELCQNPTKEVLDLLSYKSKIILLEEAYKRKSSGKKITKAEILILDEIGDNIYMLGEIPVAVHILYSSEYKGTSFDIASKRLKVHGEMRYFDEEESQWKNVEDEKLELQYLEEMKLLDSESDKIFDKNKYNVYGIISKRDNKFRIRLKPEPGKRTTGLVCSSFEESELRDIFVFNLQKFPSSISKYKKMDHEDLLKAIKGIPGALRYEPIDGRDERYLRGLLTVLTLTKTELCLKLREMFEKLDILYYK